MSEPAQIADYSYHLRPHHYRKPGVMIPHPVSDAAEGTRSAEASRRFRRRIRESVLVLAAMGLIAATTTWVLRPPDRTFEAGYGIEVERAAGHRIWTILEHGRSAAPGTIGIDSIEPIFGTDGAATTVDYAVCHLDAEVLAAEGVSGSGYGMSDRHVRRFCTRLVPAAGASMRLGTAPGQELLVGVTTTQPGRSVIRSHRIEFREGWREDTAEIHASVDITTR